jgi:hypothetical protein
VLLDSLLAHTNWLGVAKHPKGMFSYIPSPPYFEVDLLFFTCAYRPSAFIPE